MNVIKKPLNCFHCDLEVPPDLDYQATIFGASRSFCCPGCQAIAETIVGNGLTDYYKFRTSSNEKAKEILPEEIFEIESLDKATVFQSITHTIGELSTIEIGLEGITCAACGWLIKKQVSKLKGIESIEVNVTSRRAIIQFNTKQVKLSKILKEILNIGYKAFPYTEDEQEKSIKREDKAFIRRLIVAGLAMMQVMMYATGLYIGDFQDMSSQHEFFLHLVSAILATPVVFYSAKPFYLSAYQNLRQKHFGMNLPVSIAIFAGYFSSIYSLIFGHSVFYFDSIVMFTFFLLIGRYLEHKARYKAIIKQQNFKKLLPISVTKQDKAGNNQTVLVENINEGDILVINAGAVIPVDGVLLSEKAEVDEAILTGEFLPVEKFKGDQIISGSTNRSSGFLLEASSNIKNSRLNQLIQLQNSSEHITSKSVNIADKIANYYVITLLFVCTLTGLYWWSIDSSAVFPVILSVLVVSCPCALSLATPAAVAAAVSELTDSGLMIKDKTALDELSKVNEVVFDKTGTLTLGKMKIEKVNICAVESKKEAMRIAKSLESISNHPISSAFKELSTAVSPVDNPKEVIAQGVEGKIENSTYRLGKREWIEECLGTPIKNELIKDKSSHIYLYLAKDSNLMAIFTLVDSINDTATNAINTLQKMDCNITMLSGDSSAACQTTADELSIGNFVSNATPESKLTYIKNKNLNNANVLMVGDGVNDIGALSEASVGITMGSASHLSKSSSSAVLVSSDLTVVPKSIKLSKKLKLIIKQNLTWAVCYNLIALPFAMMGFVPAWLAAIGMTTSSIIVVLNALRLRF